MENFEGYSNIKKLAEGSVHVIYSAVREKDQSQVVLKTFRSAHPDADAIALMYHEYEMAQSLKSPNIIEVYEIIDQKNQYALVQEDMQGISLYNYLIKNPIRDLGFFLDLAIQMASIVGELHENRIIHKDIKPGSFIIHPETLIEKITDFGCASKLLHEVQGIVPTSKLEGTLAYMAPEQTGRMNMNIDYRSDFYALGVTFYEMLSGELPFSNNDPLELLHAHIANPVPNLSNPELEIPKMLVELVKKLMAKNPNDRYQSAIGLKSDLERCKKLLVEDGEIKFFQLGEQDVCDRLNISQKLYGREKETEILLKAYERVSKGALEALMVCGYSGIGKTKLINEIHKPMTEHKGYFISGKFDQLARNTPYTAITQAFNQLARAILAEPSSRFEAIKSDLLEALGGVAQVVIDLAPDLELILGPQPSLEKLPAQETQNRMKTYFRRFLGAVASEKHPLVIFIDDLQWIDSGSLSLLEYVMTDQELGYILLIGAYRDNEVDENHPLNQFFKKLSDKGKDISKLSLAPLEVHDFQLLFEDSLNRNDAAVEPLARLIHKRTQGNPFFFKQVINTIYKEKLLYFNHDNRQWEWDLEGITNLKATDNVIDLMLEKLFQLPKETQDLLKFAACIGNSFTIETLALVSGKSLSEVGVALWPALQEELIFTLRLGYKRIDAVRHENLGALLSKDIVYQFGHDRIQQVAYQGITDEDKGKTHLAIAKLLMQKDGGEFIKEGLFEVTDHFNCAQDLLLEDEKIVVANLNYRAAVQAQNSNAYQPMFNYLAFGIALSSEDWWTKHYDLIFSMNRAYTQSLYLTGRIDESFAFSENLLSRARDSFDKASLYRLLCVQYLAIGKAREAIDVGIKGLNLLGIRMVFKPSKWVLKARFILISWLLRGNKIDTLDSKLPEMKDSKMLMAFDIMTEIMLTTLWVDFNTFAYLGTIAIQNMLRYGAPPSSDLWGAIYAGIILTSSKNLKKAISFWKLSERYIIKKSNKYTMSTSLAYFATSYAHFFYPFREIPSYLEKGFLAGLESGNIMAAAINLLCINTSMVTAGKSRLEVEKSAIRAFNYCQKVGFHDGEQWLAIIKEIAKAYLEEGYKLSFTFNGSNPSYYAGCEAQLGIYSTFSGQYDLAYQHYCNWMKYEKLLRFRPYAILVKALYLLVLIKMMPKASFWEKIKYWRQFRSFHKDVRWGGEEFPENFLGLDLMLRGVKAAYKRKISQALKFYEQALEQTKRGDFYLLTGLISELAGDLCFENNIKNAAVKYFQDAHYYYDRYGIAIRVLALEKRYPEIFSDQSQFATVHGSRANQLVHNPTITTTTTASSTLDFMSIIKASQAISGEIILDKFFEKMLHIALENAGADKALFLEKENDSMVVVASLTLQAGGEKFEMLNASFQEYKDVSEAVVQLSVRSEEAVVLSNATEDNQYRNDAYIQRAKPKSILCLPVLHQNKVVGVIYLENNLTIGVFTQSRVVVLSTLASQIAISLVNARHIAEMQRVHTRIERFIPKQFLKLIEKENVEDTELGDCMEHEITVLMNDIRDFTAILEKQEPKQAFGFVNRYWEFMAPVIRKHAGYIDQFLGDAVMAIFPVSSDTALKAGKEILAALPSFNQRQKELGEPEINIGIGINTGRAMLGIIGEKERLEAAVISDVANAAARIEALNKRYHTHCLLSDMSVNAFKNERTHEVRKIDKVILKGRSEATYLYEVIDWSEKLKNITLLDYLKQFSEAFNFYEKGDFLRAKELLIQCRAHHPEDPIIEILLGRCSEFIAQGAPLNWDGAIRLKEK